MKLMKGCFECLEEGGGGGWVGGVYEAWRSIERADGPLQPAPEKHCRPITHTQNHHHFVFLPQSYQKDI